MKTSDRSAPDPPRRKICQTGSACDIAYAEAEDGSLPAEEFLQALDPKDFVSFSALFLLMAEHGRISNSEKFKPKVAKFECSNGDIKRGGNIAEFKIHRGSGQRVLAYRDDRQWVLVRGFPKGAHFDGEVNKARVIICEDLRRHGRRAK
jgi:hypothetical protein